MSKKVKLTIDQFKTKHWHIDEVYPLLLHREEGPAIETYYGDKQWFLNGKRHRIDGPAVEWAEGGDEEWWIDGKKYTYEEWFSKLTPEQQYNYLWNLNE